MLYLKYKTIIQNNYILKYKCKHYVILINIIIAKNPLHQENIKILNFILFQRGVYFTHIYTHYFVKACVYIIQSLEANS